MAASSPPSEALSSPQARRERGAVFGGDGVGEFVERALLGGQHHGLDVAQRDVLLLPGIEQQLFEFTRDQHHVRAEGVDQFAGRVLFELHLLLSRSAMSQRTASASSTRASSTMPQWSPSVSRMRS